MNKNTHMVGGVVLALALEQALIGCQLDVISLKTITNLSMYYSFSVLGSVLPDIDKSNTYISNRLPYVSKAITKRFKHRTITDSIIFVLLVYSILSYLDINMFITNGITIGILSHIILDLFNGRGIALLYPINTKFSIANVKTNSCNEIVLRYILIVILFVSLYKIKIN